MKKKHINCSQLVFLLLINTSANGWQSSRIFDHDVCYVTNEPVNVFNDKLDSKIFDSIFFNSLYNSRLILWDVAHLQSYVVELPIQCAVLHLVLTTYYNILTNHLCL